MKEKSKKEKPRFLSFFNYGEKFFSGLKISQWQGIFSLLTILLIILSAIHWHFPRYLPDFLSYQYTPVLIIPTLWLFVKNYPKIIKRPEEWGLVLSGGFVLAKIVYRWDPVENFLREALSGKLFGLILKVFNRFDLAFFYLMIFFGSLVLIKHQKKINEGALFLATAIFLFLEDFFKIKLLEEFIIQRSSESFLEALEGFFDELHPLVFYLALFWGIRIIWKNRQQLNQRLEKQVQREQNEETTRLQRFPKHFPRWNLPSFQSFRKNTSTLNFWINLPWMAIKKLAAGVFRWMYVEGWRYSLGLVLIVVLAFSLRIYNLGERDFQNDEFQVVGAAAGYYHTGTFYQWKWLEKETTQADGCSADATTSCRYTRAWPHTVLVAWSFKLFGEISEWTARLPSVIFGVLFVALSYFFTKFFTGDKRFSLLIALLFAVSTTLIFRAQTVRMYIMLWPFFLFTSWLFYQGLTQNNPIKFKNRKLSTFVDKYLDFNFPKLILATLLLFFCYQIHLNSLLILPVLFIFSIYLFFNHKKIKYVLLPFTGILFSSLFILSYGLITKKNLLDRLFYYLDTSKIREEYIDILLSRPLGESLGLACLILSTLFLAITTKREFRDRIVYLLVFTVTSILFFLLLADRQPNFNYISHAIPFAFILILFPLFNILSNLKTKTNSRKMLATFFFLLISIETIIALFQFYNNTDTPNFTKAYGTIKRNLASDEIIFAQFFRSYYFKDFSNAEKIPIISLGYKKDYSFEEFIEDYQKHPSGWLVWASRKGGHIDNHIKDYACQNFQHLHGSSCDEKIDESEVEVFFYKKPNY